MDKLRQQPEDPRDGGGGGVLQHEARPRRGTYQDRLAWGSRISALHLVTAQGRGLVRMWAEGELKQVGELTGHDGEIQVSLHIYSKSQVPHGASVKTEGAPSVF